MVLQLNNPFREGKKESKIAKGSGIKEAATEDNKY